RLLEEVWGYDSDVASRTVDVHVSSLRQKIGDDPNRPRWIVTVRGFGGREARGVMRDWLHVEDHCRALLAVLERGTPGRVYNIGAGEEHTNLEVTRAVLRLTGTDPSRVRMIEDRPGHDRRYALDISRIEGELGWSPAVGFEEGLSATVDWYRGNRAWWEEIKSGRFREYYLSMYGRRLASGRGMGGGS
ncbi:MAG TPA: winged helix-turn-helix domain-containing protein, partial [Candidatus Fermentibacter sp.]|nr:winged helix-turn-helix domain-containing protein [Candidatus Fermentibacter sp.]